MHVWDTATLPARDQMPYWADVVCEAFTPLAPTRDRDHLSRSRSRDGLFGWVRSARLSSTNSAEIASCTQRLSHGAAEVRRSPSEEVFVNLQLAGTCRGEQDGRQCVVRPGEFALFDTTHPYTLEFEESGAGRPWHVLSFRIPRDRVIELIPANTRFTARTIADASGPGAVAANMMKTLWATSPDLGPSTRTTLDNACTQVIADALSTFAPSAPLDRAGADDALRVTARRFIVEHLSGGTIPAEAAARHIGVSVRRLHQLFAAEGTTFGSVVRETRLREVARSLTNEADTRPLADIAAAWGFYDGPHLSRLFRERFGCTPSEYRAGHRPAR
jgi:AraC-like DNA-binding protein